jgi:hypothetical protein
LIVAEIDGNLRPISGESDGGGLPDAATGSRYQHDPISKRKK